MFSEAEEEFADGGEDDNDIPVEGHYPAKKLRRWRLAPVVPEDYGKPGEMGKFINTCYAHFYDFYFNHKRKI